MNKHLCAVWLLQSCLLAHADEAFRSGDIEIKNGVRTMYVNDLKNDGKRDRLVARQEECGATGNCSYELYISNAKGFSHSGTIAAAFIVGDKTRHQGRNDIWAY